jgi:hypothetical protein
MPPRSSAPAQLRSEPAERLTAHEGVISDRYAMLPGHQGYYVFLAKDGHGRLRDYLWRKPRWAGLSGAEAQARSTAGGSRCPR